jgi:hypothetical protein
MNSCVAFAEFVSINPLCRHITSPKNGSAGVVILPNTTANTGPAGLIIYSSDKSISAQGFRVSSVPAKGSKSFFLKFNRETKKFSDLTISGGKTYRLDGNISIDLSNIKINISYENNHDVYTSVIFKPDASIFALSGLEPVINGKGDSFISWLGKESVANSEVMSVDEDANLIVAGSVYKGEKIGLPNQNLNQNICMNTGVIFISASSLEDLQKRVSSNQLSQTEKSNLMRKSSDFYQKNTLLVMLQQGVVVQDGYGQLLTVKPSPRKLFDDQIVCTVEGLS